MVTNLPAEAKAKWAEVTACRSILEKIKLMREFISLVPKHKGTSKLLANVKSRISELERELERSKTRRRGGRSFGFSIPKEGAGQIIILGMPNAGKSSLLASLTNARPEISPLPFTTQKPIPGMLQYEDVQFQLVEAPAIVKGASEGRMGGTQILGLARNADGLIITVDLSENPIEQFDTIHSELEKAGILIERPEGEVKVIRRGHGGIQIVGGGVLVDCAYADVKNLLESYRISSALVKISGKVRLDDIENALFSSNIYKPTIIVANKVDLLNTEVKVSLLKEALKRKGIPLVVASCVNGQGLESLGRSIFQALRIIRVYTKEPSLREPSRKPLVVEEGTSVVEVARKLHSEFYRGFKYARVWGSSVKHLGEKVGSKHILMDGDIVEIHY